MGLNFVCPICHGEYKVTDEISSLRCGHVFHRKCLKTWLIRSKTCPECRQSVIFGEVRPIYITSHDQDINAAKETDVVAESWALKSRIEQSILSLSQLRNLLDEGKEEYISMHTLEVERSQLLRERNYSDDSIQALTQKLDKARSENRKLVSEIKDKNKIIAEITEFEKTKKHLNDIIKELLEKSVANEARTKELMDKFVELQKQMGSTSFVAGKTPLQRSMSTALPLVGKIRQAASEHSIQTESIMKQFKKFDANLSLPTVSTADNIKKRSSVATFQISNDLEVKLRTSR